MKVLLDENLPPRLRPHLMPHDVYTAEFQGWKSLRNGTLLAQAEAAAFEAFITVDQNLTYQQNTAKSRLGFIILTSNLWPKIAPRVDQILRALETCTLGSIQKIEL